MFNQLKHMYKTVSNFIENLRIDYINFMEDRQEAAKNRKNDQKMKARLNNAKREREGKNQLLKIVG